MKIFILAVTLGAATVGAISNNTSDSTTRRTTQQTSFADSLKATGVPTQVAMRNVNFYVTPTAALHIRSLRGEMRSLRGGPVVFDDKTSFAIRVDHAEVGLSGNDLSSLMNNVVFAYRGAPLKHMKVHMAGNQLVQSGVMHKIVDIPFQMVADVSATPDGLIRLHPAQTRILGIDGNGLMRAFGLTLQKILDVRKAKGVTIVGNDLYLDPSKLLPPPAFEGRLTAVRVDGDELVQTFDRGSPSGSLPVPDPSAPAYMYYKGGVLRFGKMLMMDAEMQIVALHPRGTFGFDLDRYKQQLVAGYSKTLVDSGLEVFMASVETLPEKGSAQSSDAAAATH